MKILNLSAIAGYSFQDFESIGNSVRGFGFSTTDLNGMVRDFRGSLEALENSIPFDYQNFAYDADGVFATQIVPSS